MAVNGSMFLDRERAARNGQIACPRMTGISQLYRSAGGTGAAALGSMGFAEAPEGTVALPGPSTRLSAAWHSWGCSKEDPCPSGVPHPSMSSPED